MHEHCQIPVDVSVITHSEACKSLPQPSWCSRSVDLLPAAHRFLCLKYSQEINNLHCSLGQGSCVGASLGVKSACSICISVMSYNAHRSELSRWSVVLPVSVFSIAGSKLAQSTDVSACYHHIHSVQPFLKSSLIVVRVKGKSLESWKKRSPKFGHWQWLVSLPFDALLILIFVHMNCFGVY
jgi:hypothetical protein